MCRVRLWCVVCFYMTYHNASFVVGENKFLVCVDGVYENSAG